MTSQTNRSGQGPASAVLRVFADRDRSPVFAAIGVGDVLRSAALDTVRKVRADMRHRRDDAADTFNLAFGELPRNLDDLVHQVTPAELRKRAEHCRRFGLDLYEFLSARGEIAASKVQSDPDSGAGNGKLDLGVVGVRLAAAAADDIQRLAARLLQRSADADSPSDE